MNVKILSQLQRNPANFRLEKTPSYSIDISTPTPSPPEMIETSSPGISMKRCGSPLEQPLNTNHPANYLTTAMLQNCGYLGQRLQSVFQQNEDYTEDHMIQRSTSTGATATSLFTIDSILAPKDKGSESPVSPSSNSSATTSPVRPQHVPAMLQHPGLHLGHLAAAAGFGSSPSDFLGEFSYLLLLFGVKFNSILSTIKSNRFELSKQI